MKKLFNLILIFIFMLTINVKADTICILGECITEGTLTKNGDTGTMTADINNKTITLDNFNKVINSSSDISTSPIGSYNIRNIMSSNIMGFNIIIKGNNSITINDLGENISFSIFEGSKYTISGLNNAKLDITLNAREDKSNINIVNFHYQSGQSDENRVININDVEINVDAKDSSLKTFTFVSNPSFLNINNSKLSAVIGDNKFTDYFYSDIDFIGIEANNINITDSEFSFKMNYIAQNQIRGIIVKNLEVLRSKINFDIQYSYIEQEAISYRYNVESTSYVFKDSYFKSRTINGNTIHSHAQNVYIEFDNTELDLANYSTQGKLLYGVFYTKNDLDPEIIFKNYGEKTLLFKGKDNSSNEIIVGINKFSNLKNVGLVNTIKRGTINTQIEDIDNIYELTDEDKDNMDIGYDITLSITQELINPTESIINLVKDKQILDYFDINFVKEVNENKTNIHELKKEIEVNIPLKDSYKKNNRTYKVLRIHENVVDELDTEIKGDFIVFKTDKFSTYVLTYSDIINNPKTGDNLLIYLLLSFISFLSAITISKRTRKI